jgi:tRNA nucleotidyltransferase/poly(A) polymerase
MYSAIPASKRPCTLTTTDVPVTPELVITPAEAKLFDRMRQICRDNNLTTQVRVAGGWVRDKILGGSCTDIDFAFDNMTGAAFAPMFNRFLKLQGEAEVKMAVIQVNPLQSKHLETVTFTVDGFALDMNNLRKEVYDEHSRIPRMVLGSPAEDALRRDFTINSLFFNISAEPPCVEDFTGRGLEDLRAGIVRTPLDPHVTFNDDPLRILRAARFAGKFGFALSADLIQALCVATSPE